MESDEVDENTLVFGHALHLGNVSLAGLELWVHAATKGNAHDIDHEPRKGRMDLSLEDCRRGGRDMSRSYKKSSAVKYTQHRRHSYEKPKTWANRKVRRNDEIPSGKSGYKKLFDSYNICDEKYFDGHTFKNLYAAWVKNKDFVHLCGDTYDEVYKCWKKIYYKK